MKTLQQHIDEKYSGNKSEFAKANGKTQQWANEILKVPAVVINGRRYIDKGEIN